MTDDIPVQSGPEKRRRHAEGASPSVLLTAWNFLRGASTAHGKPGPGRADIVPPPAIDNPPPTIQIKGVKQVIVRGAGGTYRYYYHRATRQRIKAAFASPEFFLEIAQLDTTRHDSIQTGVSLHALIATYRASREFTLLAPQTQRKYEKAFLWLGVIGDMPMAAMSPDLPYRLRDKACQQYDERFASALLQAMRVLLAWGRPRGYVTGIAAAPIPCATRARP